MTPFPEDEVAWENLSTEERLRDCFAEAETAMEGAVELLRLDSALATTPLADLARDMQTICARLRRLFDHLRRPEDGEEGSESSAFAPSSPRLGEP
jgi:hypothetical protein